MKNANTTIEDEQKFDEALAEADFSESIKSGAWIKGRRGRPKIGDKHAVILPPELFSGPYFCKHEDEALFELARPVEDHPSVIAMRALAARLKVAIPTSFFERDGQHYYNTCLLYTSDAADE